MSETLQMVSEKSSDRRSARMHNICVAILLNKEEWKGKEISTRRIRKAVREQLDYPELTGEDYLGDLRATGDAIGGHGLKFETRRYRSHKLLYIDDAVIEDCKKFLEEDDVPKILL